MPISSGSQRILDKFGPETHRPWKENFYIRNIQQLVGLNINLDYDELNPLEKAKALQAFVNNWPQSEREETELANTLKNFEAVARQSLPGVVTRQFSNPSVKKQIQTAYQELILLEIVYQIQVLASEQTSLTPEWDSIKKWAKAQEAKLVPNFFASGFRTMRVKLFGSFFEDSLLLITDIIPYFIKTTLKLSFHAAQRSFNGQTNYSEKLKNLSLGTIEAAIIPLSLSLKLLAHLYKPLNNITSLPFELVEYLCGKNNFSNLQFWTKVLKYIKNTFLFVAALYYTASLIIMIGTISAGIYIFSSIGLGIAFNAFDKLFEKLGLKHQIIKPGSPLLGTQEILILSLSTFSISNPSKITSAITKMKELYHNLLSILNRFRTVNEASPLGTREQIAQDLSQQYGNLDRFASEYLGLDFSAFWMEIDRSFRHQLGLAVSAPQSPSPQKTQEASYDYDRNKLIGQILRLKSNLENTQEKEGPEVVKALNEIKNPHTYLAAHKRISDLPKGLRKFASPAAPLRDNDQRTRISPH